jgi:hypothetical protein
VFVVALAPVLATLFAVVMGASFARAVADQLIALIPNGTWAVAVAVFTIALVGVYATYSLWALITRRSSWLSMRGFQFTMPLIALLALVTVDTMAGYINEPWIFALGGELEESYLGDASTVLAVGVVLAGALAATVTSYAAGPCRHLKTGIAPERVRRRHIGPVPGPVETRRPAHSFHLIAAEVDLPVAEEVRQALVAVGMAEVGDDRGSDRQIVVMSDRTPAEWLSRDGLREPLAVVATSIALPVRGVLHRFQWVDYRHRRSQTLAAFARDLTAKASGPGAGGFPPLPESLQQVRLPTWLIIVEWTLFAMATLAVMVAAYPLVQWVFTDRHADLWPALLSLPIAGALVMLARLVRGRRIIPGGLVAVVAASWLGMFACGLDGVARAIFGQAGTGPDISPSLGYSLVSAMVFGLAWRSLRRWLPRHLRREETTQPTLGSVGGSWPWRVAVAPLVLGFLSATGLNAPADTSAPAIETLMDAPDVCDDRAEMLGFLTPLGPVNEALQVPDIAGVRSALEQRIQLIPSLLDDLERFEPAGPWGTDMKARLMAGLEGVARADRAYLGEGLDVSEDYDEMDRVVEDLNAPFC